jgi:hypothetical protein
MARRKETIWQADFGMGSVRPEAVERVEIVERSVKDALNTVSLSTGQIEARPGTVYERTTTAKRGFDIDLGGGRLYHLLILPVGFQIFNASMVLIASDTETDWTDLEGGYGSPSFATMQFWVVPDPDTSSIIIGSQFFPMQVLAVDGAGAWTIAPFAYDTAFNGRVAVPFYPFHPQTSIAPSGYTGSITLTASGGDLAWTDAHEGVYVRYNGRLIQLGTRVSDTVINATVIETLPTAYDVEVTDVDGFTRGDIVEDQTLGGQGIIITVDILGNGFVLQGLTNWAEFAVTNQIVGPGASSDIVTLTARSAPAPLPFWDMQMFQPVHGYPGWGARHKGRLYLCDGPTLPQAFAASQPGIINNFEAGPDDGDAFVETIGSDRGGSLRYIISTGGDLLFFTTRAAYYQFTRDGAPITPLTIAPVPFSQYGCADIPPAVVDDGVVFVDSTRSQIFAAVLTGDVYKSWRARSVTEFHNHLVGTPVYLGATQGNSQRPEQFIYAVRDDGKVAVCQWNIDESNLSWRLWETAGSFTAIYEAVGNVYALVDRTIDGAAVRFLERFNASAYLDAMSALSVSAAAPLGATGVPYFGGLTAAATHLEGATVPVYFEGWDYGDLVIDATGRALDALGAQVSYGTAYAGLVQVGLGFTSRIVPWSRRSSRTQYATRDVKRLIEVLVTVQDTGLMKINGDEFNSYFAGENTDQPPPLRAREVRYVVSGGRSFEEIPIVKDRPGPFRLLKLGYRVTV